MTPFEAIRGKRATKPICKLGEHILYHPLEDQTRQLGKMQDFKASASQARLKLHDCEGSLQDEIERRKQVRFIRTSPVPWLGRLLRKP